MRKRMLWIPLALVSSWFVLHVTLMLRDGLTDTGPGADLVVVLGNEVLPSGVPSERLAARLDAALRYRQSSPGVAVLVSGGRGKSGYEEAHVMRDYLVRRGIDPADLYIDTRGLTTRHTAVNTRVLMETKGWNRAVVATQYFHVSRSKLAFRQAGQSRVGSVHARYFELRDLYSIPREVVGFYAYLLGARAPRPAPPKSGLDAPRF